MSGNIKPSGNNMWQTTATDGLNDPPQLDDIVVNGPTGPTGPTGPAGSGGGSANTGTPADRIVLPPVKWVVAQPWYAITGYFGGGYSQTSETGKLNSNLNVPLSDYVHEISGNQSNPDQIVEGLNGGPTAFAAGPQIGDRVLFCDQYADQYQFIYTITALGETDVSGWELTPTDDIDLDPFSEWFAYAVAVEETTVYAESSAGSVNDKRSYSYAWNLNMDNSRAYGHAAMAMGSNSLAIGNYAEASNRDAVSIGANSVARGQESVAIGTNARVDKDYSIVIGYGSGADAYGGAIPDIGVTIGSQDGGANPIKRVLNANSNGGIGDTAQGAFIIFTGSVTSYSIWGANFLQGSSANFLNTTGGEVTITSHSTMYLNGVNDGTFAIPDGQCVTLIRLDGSHWWIY